MIERLDFNLKINFGGTRVTAGGHRNVLIDPAGDRAGQYTNRKETEGEV